MKWKEVSCTVLELGLLTKDIFRVIANEPLGVEKLDEETRKILQKGLGRLRKIWSAEKAAEEIVEEVKQRRQQTEDDMWLVLDEYIALGDSERRDLDV